MLSLLYTSDASIPPWKRPWRRHKHNRKHKHKDQNFSSFLRLRCNKWKRNTTQVWSKRIFTTRGNILPVKTLDPDYLAPQQFGRFGWFCLTVRLCRISFSLGSSLLLAPVLASLVNYNSVIENSRKRITSEGENHCRFCGVILKFHQIHTAKWLNSHCWKINILFKKILLKELNYSRLFCIFYWLLFKEIEICLWLWRVVPFSTAPIKIPSDNGNVFLFL